MIDIANLSERLNLSQEEGEKWIVNLIQETRMGVDAKIDLERVRHLFIFHFFFTLISYNQNIVVINRPPQLVYKNVIEKTRQLAVYIHRPWVSPWRVPANKAAPSAETDQQTAQARSCTPRYRVAM